MSQPNAYLTVVDVWAHNTCPIPYGWAQYLFPSLIGQPMIYDLI